MMAKASSDKIVEIFRELSKMPSITKACVTCHSSAILNLNVEWNQRDLENFSITKSMNSYMIELPSLVKIFKNHPIDISTELLSKNWKNYRAVLRKIVNKNTEEKQMLEVWKNCSKIVNIDIELMELHGKIYEDDQFGCFQWSHDGKQLLYVAEKKLPKTESFFKTSACTLNEGDGENAKFASTNIKGDEFLFREDWGEKFKGKCHSILCILNVGKNSVNLVKDLPDGYSFGQAIWTPDGMGIVCIGWLQEPRRLGIAVCSNRKSALFYFNLCTHNYEIIGSAEKSVRSPRFSMDGKKLVYLESDVGGPHHKGCRLILCCWPSRTTEIILDLVNGDKGGGFPGLYLFSLPEKVWVDDNKTLVFNCHWGSREELICVNTETKEVTKLSKDNEIGSWNLLDITNDILIVACSSPNMNEHICLGKLPQDPETEMIEWIKLDDENQEISEIEWKILSFDPHPDAVNAKYPNLQLEVILLKPTSETTDRQYPLIICPHGGPHSGHVASYKHSLAAFAKLGFATALINYRGSAGYGENNLNSLLGNIGTQDVLDCKYAVDYLVTNEGFDKNRLVAYGGSHGGFLVTHLIGQFPDLFKACVCINGVTDLPCKFNISDIPDWGWVEAGLIYSDQCLSSPETLRIMWEKSPCQYFEQIRTPTLILMGKLDVRVPPSQSLTLYNALKARKVPARMNVYEDGHGLRKPDVEADAFVHTVLWFNTYLNLM